MEGGSWEGINVQRPPPESTQFTWKGGLGAEKLLESGVMRWRHTEGTFPYAACEGLDPLSPVLGQRAGTSMAQEAGWQALQADLHHHPLLPRTFYLR